MSTNEILKEVNEIFIDVLENKQIKLEFNTTARDIEEWDSLNHIQLVVAIEKHFKQRFTAKEVSDWSSVGEMCNSIQKRMNG